MSVQISTDEAAVTVRFRGLDRFWACSRGLMIPYARITAAAVVPRSEAKAACPKLRALGSYIPGRLQCGRYGLGARQQMWNVHRADHVLALDLTGRPFARVVLETPDAAALAQHINAVRG